MPHYDVMPCKNRIM